MTLETSNGTLLSSETIQEMREYLAGTVNDMEQVEIDELPDPHVVWAIQRNYPDGIDGFIRDGARRNEQYQDFLNSDDAIGTPWEHIDG